MIKDRQIVDAEFAAWRASGLPDPQAAGTARKAQADGLVRRAYAEAFRAGVDFARRTPGPATARMLKHVAVLAESPVGCEVFLAVAENIRDDAPAFIAEVGPAGPEGGS